MIVIVGVAACSALTDSGLTHRRRNAATRASAGKNKALLLRRTLRSVHDFADVDVTDAVSVQGSEPISLKSDHLLPVRSVFCMSCAEKVLFLRLGKKQGAHPSSTEHIRRFDSRFVSFAVASRFVADCAVTFSIETVCHLSKAKRRRYLKVETREWLLNSAVLDEIENDLQLVVNCSRPGDVLLLDTSKTIRPPSRTVIPWPLTINGYVRGGEHDRVSISASEKRTILTCPQKNEGLFTIR